jgi:hypothetical protein
VLRICRLQHIVNEIIDVITWLPKNKGLLNHNRFIYLSIGIGMDLISYILILLSFKVLVRSMKILLKITKMYT